MIYKTNNFEEIVQKMASCEQLGLSYLIQRDTEEKKKIGFGRRGTTTEPVWVLQIVEYVEESEGLEAENL